MRLEEEVKLAALDRAATVLHFDGPSLGVPRDDDLRAEGNDAGVGGDELAVVVADVLAAGGDALGLGAAALFARAIAGDFHDDRAGGGPLDQDLLPLGSGELDQRTNDRFCWRRRLLMRLAGRADEREDENGTEN